jgi:hypothetical protein
VGPSDRGFKTTALGAPASDATTVGGDPSPPCSTALPVLILASLGSSLVVVVTADPASGARATVSVTEEAVPRFANLSEGQACRVEQPPRQQPEQWPLGCAAPRDRMRERGRASIDGGSRTVRGR